MNGGHSAIWAACLCLWLGACLDSGKGVGWPDVDLEAVFVLSVGPAGDVQSIEGPYRIGPGASPVQVRTVQGSERLFLLGFSAAVLRALPGGYDPNLSDRIKLAPGLEGCLETGRLITQGEEQSVQVRIPAGSSLFELDASSAQFEEARDRAWLEDWSVEMPLVRWCDAGEDIPLERFGTDGREQFSELDEVNAVVRLDDDRMVVLDSRFLPNDGRDVTAVLVERGRATGFEPGRAVTLRDPTLSDYTLPGQILRDLVRSTEAQTVLLTWVSGRNRSQSALIELTVDANGLRQTARHDFIDGSIWEALIDPRGRFFAIGGTCVDQDDNCPEGTIGLVITATTSAGPFHTERYPGLGLRTLSRSPLPDAPHWVGTEQGAILEGDLSRSLQTFVEFRPDTGSITSVVALGTPGEDIQGVATTSARIPIERIDSDWVQSIGSPLPPRVKDCAAVANADECGWQRWLAARVNAHDWSAERPWEARFAPLCDVLFLWDAKERCMSVAAEDLDAIGGNRGWHGSDLDADGQRLTVVGARGRIVEGWYTTR